MNFIVLAGSPKGEKSVTLQYVNYLQKHHPEHRYEIVHVAQSIQKIENDEVTFQKLMDAIEVSEGVIWAFPLYVMMVHGNYKRFIELIFERNKTAVFKGKASLLLCTSIHFFDHTALRYMEQILMDLEMDYYDSFSAEMRDLTFKKERERLLQFSNGFHHHVEGYIHFEKTKSLKVALVSDYATDEANGVAALNYLKSQLPGSVDEFHLQELKVLGSCMGCLKCGNKNQCVYEGKDDVIEFYRKLQTYDVIVYALEIKDRYFSAKWKQVVDRRFFVTHQPLFKDQHIAYCVKGDLGQNENLREIIISNALFDKSQLSGIVDFVQFDAEVKKQLEKLTLKLTYETKVGYVAPQNFLGVGGSKIFRDEIWGNLRMVFMADHRYFRRNGHYDFPHKNRGIRLLNLFAPLLRSIPAFNRYMEENMTTLMLRAYKNLE